MTTTQDHDEEFLPRIGAMNTPTAKRCLYEGDYKTYEGRGVRHKARWDETTDPEYRESIIEELLGIYIGMLAHGDHAAESLRDLVFFQMISWGLIKILDDRFDVACEMGDEA